MCSKYAAYIIKVGYISCDLHFPVKCTGERVQLLACRTGYEELLAIKQQGTLKVELLNTTKATVLYSQKCWRRWIKK